MMKDFDNWNKRKKAIQQTEKPQNFFCKEREIWWCGLGVNIGVETDGKNDSFERPVLILKFFNREMVWVLPITSRIGPQKFYYPLVYNQLKQAVILSQLRVISSKRLFRKIKILSEAEFAPIVDAVIGFLQQNETPPKAGNLGARRR